MHYLHASYALHMYQYRITRVALQQHSLSGYQMLPSRHMIALLSQYVEFISLSAKVEMFNVVNPCFLS